MEKPAKFNPARKSDWSSIHPRLVAEHYGYVCTPGFIRALQKYREEVVDPARIDDYLGLVAISFFQDFQPPLQRLPKTELANQTLSIAF